MTQKRTSSHRSTSAHEKRQHEQQYYDYYHEKKHPVHHTAAPPVRKHRKIPLLERRGMVWFMLILAIIYMILFTRVMKIILP